MDDKRHDERDERDGERHDKAEEKRDGERTGSADGLVPAEARDWLALQQVFAWHPERVGERIRAGESPRRILLTRRGQPFRKSVMPASARQAGECARQARRLEELGVRVVPLPDPAYPQCLGTLSDAPLVLLVKGEVAALGSGPAIAIVGARAATRSARAMARRLARDLSGAGFVIVSGLARGIDAEAHRGALEGGGRTLGVLACGLDRIYPPEHRALADEIARSGAILSEMPLGVAPRRAHFPLRNRIISGLCKAVIVVEARRRSGSLITVRHALEQGREVFVVPGSADGPFAEGSNRLLRDGARAIRCAGDVIEDLGGLPGLVGAGSDRIPRLFPERGEPGGGDLCARILDVLQREPSTRDELMVHAGFDEGQLATALLELELTGRIVLERDGRMHATWG